MNVPNNKTISGESLDGGNAAKTYDEVKSEVTSKGNCSFRSEENADIHPQECWRL